MIFFRLSKYLKYMFLARHQKGHGIHSPFVFDFASRILRNKTDSAVVCNIEKVRKRLKSDNRSLLVNDLGAGASRRKSNLRKVSDIARYSPVTKKYGCLLSNLSSEFGKPMILELGTSLGISTMYLASGCPEAVIYTIEGIPEIAEIARQNFTESRLTNIKVLSGSFDEMLPVVFETGITPGLVFIDGDHRKEQVMRYFDKISEISDRNTVVVVDDIYYSKEMTEAWNEMKINENISVTIDIFRMGILFFRRGINNINYTVRY